MGIFSASKRLQTFHSLKFVTSKEDVWGSVDREIFSHFFFSLLYIFFQILKLYHAFSANLKTFLGPMILRSAILSTSRYHEKWMSKPTCWSFCQTSLAQKQLEFDEATWTLSKQQYMIDNKHLNGRKFRSVNNPRSGKFHCVKWIFTTSFQFKNLSCKIIKWFGYGIFSISRPDIKIYN